MDLSPHVCKMALSEGQQDFENEKESEKPSAAVTIVAGSLPEWSSWKNFETHSDVPAAMDLIVPSNISRSLGSTHLRTDTLNHASPHCSHLSKSSQALIYLPDNTTHIKLISPNVESKTREFDRILCNTYRHMVCCYGEPCPASPCQGGGQSRSDCDETTPLLASYSRSEQICKGVIGEKREEQKNDDERTVFMVHSRFRRFSRNQILTLFSMLGVVMVAFASLSVMAPFFPHQVERLNLGGAIDGVIFSIYPCVMFLTSPIIGKLLPLFDSHVVYLVGITLTGIANILFGLVSFINSVSLFLVISIGLRVLAALGTSCFLTVIYALVPIIFPDDVNVVTGMLETSIGMGMCLGPALGMWLYSMGGFPMPFFGLGVFIFLTLVINCFTFPENELLIISNCGSRAVWSILSHPRSCLSLLILCITAVCSSTLYPTLQPHMIKLGISTRGVCMIYLVLSAMYAVSAPLVGLAIDRYGGLDNFMLLGLMLTSLSFILIGNSPLLPSPPSHQRLYVQDLVGMVVFGVSSAMCIVPTFSSILRAAASNMEIDMGTYSVIGGLWSSAYSLGDMLGPLYAGLLADHTTFASATTLTALLPAALAVVFGIYMCANRNNTASPISQ